MNTSTIRTAFALGVAGLLWALPFMHVSWPTGMSAHDFARLFELGLLVLAALLWVGSPSSYVPAGWRRWALAALALLLAISALHAAHPLAAFREVALMSGLLVLALVLARPLAEARCRDLFLALVTVGAGVYAAVALLLLVLATQAGTAFSPWDLLPGFDNVRFLNHAQTIVLPLVGIVLARDHASRWLRVAAALALFVGGGILALYVARASILGLLIGAMAALWIAGRDSRRYVMGVSVCVVAGMVAMGIAWKLWIAELLGSAMTNDISSPHFRGYLAGLAWDLFRSSPWVGVGPMHFAHAINPVAAHPHNFYMQTLAEIGLPATILLAGFALAGLHQTRRTMLRVASKSPELAAGLTAATVALLVDAGFSGSFVMPISQMWCAVLIALLVGLNKQGATSSADPTSAMPVGLAQRLLRVAVVALMIVAATMASLEAGDPATIHVDTGEPMKAAIGEPALNPRFWAHGWF